MPKGQDSKRGGGEKNEGKTSETKITKTRGPFPPPNEKVPVSLAREQKTNRKLLRKERKDGRYNKSETVRQWPILLKHAAQPGHGEQHQERKIQGGGSTEGTMESPKMRARLLLYSWK